MLYPFCPMHIILCNLICFLNLSSDIKINFQGTSEYLFFACLSKLFAAITTYPYQVVRARLQDQHSIYSSATDCVRQTLRYEGIRGLYKGMSPYLVHVLPNICMVLLIYEKMTTVSWFKIDMKIIIIFILFPIRIG